MEAACSRGCWQDTSVPSRMDLSIGLPECPHHMAAVNGPRENEEEGAVPSRTCLRRSQFQQLCTVTSLFVRSKSLSIASTEGRELGSISEGRRVEGFGAIFKNHPRRENDFTVCYRP